MSLLAPGCVCCAATPGEAVQCVRGWGAEASPASGALVASGGGVAPRVVGGRPVGPVRAALREVIGAGLSGPADALAALTGWPPESVRRTLKEMRREGELGEEGVVLSGRRSRGRPAKVYGAPTRPDYGPAQTLAFVQQVWR